MAGDSRFVPAPLRPPSALNGLNQGLVSANPSVTLTGPTMTMLYDFYAEVGSQEELSVEAGEMVMLLQPLEDWNLVRSMRTGEVGIVPANHMSFI